MNMVALSNRLASKVPHWHELEKLSKEDKIDVIALLSMSIANAEEIKKPENRTKEMIERCCGSWVGEQSAEDIIANINESKISKSKPVKFGWYELLVGYQYLCIFAVQKAFLRKKGQLIEDADIIIGTTAIINNMVMVTENVKHIGRLNGIVVENWVEK